MAPLDWEKKRGGREEKKRRWIVKDPRASLKRLWNPFREWQHRFCIHFPPCLLARLRSVSLVAAFCRTRNTRGKARSTLKLAEYYNETTENYDGRANAMERNKRGNLEKLYVVKYDRSSRSCACTSSVYVPHNSHDIMDLFPWNETRTMIRLLRLFQFEPFSTRCERKLGNFQLIIRIHLFSL